MLKATEKDKSGYELHDFGNYWQLRGPKNTFTGSLKDVIVYAVREQGFDFDELTIGVLEMEKHFHNAAEYGIFKRFMWSYDREEKNETAIRN